MSPRTIIFIAAILCALSVIFGAFGAHALQKVLAERMQHTFHTGVEYQFYHSIALLFIGLYLTNQPENRFIKLAIYCIMIGILFFSGSLYLLSLRDYLNFEGWIIKIIGPVTPLGGIFFIIGWVFLAIGAKKAQ
jgi:uncharacterized membrane protein YgdD (TMEM256/DUF423 family)